MSDAEETGQPTTALLDPVKRWSRGRYSVARPMKHWYVLALSTELRDAPISRMVFGIPIVLFRDAKGKARALLDRCPHRNVPLSPGRVVGGNLECPYHGWQFDGGGACKLIPSLVGDPCAKARNAPSFPTCEQDGFVWVMPTPDAEPDSEPHRFQYAHEKGYSTVRQWIDMRGTLHAALENALDVPHTAFLHKGLFRSDSRGIKLDVKVKRTKDRVEASYHGEPRPPGLVGWLLSPSGGQVEHMDRFVLPCVAEVEYRLGKENHLLVGSAMTPVSDFETRIFGCASFKLRVPHWLVMLVMPLLAKKVLKQDAMMLARQTDHVKLFGGEQYAWTDIDVLGKHIWWLLRSAERGDAGGDAVVEESVQLVV